MDVQNVPNSSVETNKKGDSVSGTRYTTYAKLANRVTDHIISTIDDSYLIFSIVIGFFIAVMLLFFYNEKITDNKFLGLVLVMGEWIAFVIILEILFTLVGNNTKKK
jgi:hypothetical protein